VAEAVDAAIVVFAFEVVLRVYVDDAFDGELGQDVVEPASGLDVGV
jgi:hypothetical protein